MATPAIAASVRSAASAVAARVAAPMRGRAHSCALAPAFSAFSATGLRAFSASSAALLVCLTASAPRSHAPFPTVCAISKMSTSSSCWTSSLCSPFPTAPLAAPSSLFWAASASVGQEGHWINGMSSVAGGDRSTVAPPLPPDTRERAVEAAAVKKATTLAKKRFMYLLTAAAAARTAVQDLFTADTGTLATPETDGAVALKRATTHPTIVESFLATRPGARLTGAPPSALSFSPTFFSTPSYIRLNSWSAPLDALRPINLRTPGLLLQRERATDTAVVEKAWA
mmetsp:Transcript_22323/g.54307  ORF Transcript_22323/g.54307 Transcript_22323/m.54307 type:complete len:284 (-) Transcript_22323:163-1014(-)